MTDPTTALREVLALSNKVRDAEENREYGAANDLYADLQDAAVNLALTHGPALLSALEDARRLRYLMDDACVEGFVGVDGDVHDFAFYVADDNEREEPSADDYLEGFRRMIDAAIDAAIAEGDQE